MRRLVLGALFGTIRRRPYARNIQDASDARDFSARRFVRHNQTPSPRRRLPLLPVCSLRSLRYTTRCVHHSKYPSVREAKAVSKQLKPKSKVALMRLGTLAKKTQAGHTLPAEALFRQRVALTKPDFGGLI